MATAVTLDEQATSRLEELRAEIKLRTGEKVTQQEILTRLVDDAYESRSETVFADDFDGIVDDPAALVE